MQPALLVFFVLAALVGVALLVGAIAIGVWLRRMNRARALKTYLWASISGVLAFLAVLGALVLTMVLEARGPSLEHPPGRVLAVVGLWLLALCATGACALFGVWTIWRLMQSPQSQPLHTTPAT